MAQTPQLPKPEEVAGALASFPPKLSVLAKPLAFPEEFFENSVKTATGVEIPPGPTKILVSFMESFEAGAPALPALPTQAPATTPTVPQKPQEKQAPPATSKIDVEVF